MEKPKNYTCDDYRPEQLNQTTRKQTLHIHHHAVASRVAAKYPELGHRRRNHKKRNRRSPPKARAGAAAPLGCRPPMDKEHHARVCDRRVAFLGGLKHGWGKEYCKSATVWVAFHLDRKEQKATRDLLVRKGLQARREN